MPEEFTLVSPVRPKPELAKRPILYAKDTYNFLLAKWLDEKLKAISTNKFIISDPLQFPKSYVRKGLLTVKPSCPKIGLEDRICLFDIYGRPS